VGFRIPILAFPWLADFGYCILFADFLSHFWQLHPILANTRQLHDFGLFSWIIQLWSDIGSLPNLSKMTWRTVQRYYTGKKWHFHANISMVMSVLNLLYKTCNKSVYCKCISVTFPGNFMRPGHFLYQTIDMLLDFLTIQKIWYLHEISLVNDTWHTVIFPTYAVQKFDI